MSCSLCVCGIAIHSIVDEVLRFSNSIAPERLAFNSEVRDRPSLRSIHCEGHRPPIAIVASVKAIPVPPVLAVADNSAGIVCVNDEIATGNDEPRGLTLHHYT